MMQGSTVKNLVQEPVVSHETVAGEDCEVRSHPAYAQIFASRISGGATLYGSDLRHSSFVRLRIAGSTLTRRGCSDWAMPADVAMVEVDMSEADWATFVSSMNVGNGAQCTLRRFNGEVMPQLPAPKGRAEQFSAEMAATIERGMQGLKSLKESVESLKLSEKQKAKLLADIASAERNFAANTNFVAEQFDEHMERTVERAKADFNGFIAFTFKQGEDHLAQGGPSTRRAPPSLDYAPGASQRSTPPEGEGGLPE
jgi:hypothetical protein